MILRTARIAEQSTTLAIPHSCTRYAWHDIDAAMNWAPVRYVGKVHFDWLVVDRFRLVAVPLNRCFRDADDASNGADRFHRVIVDVLFRRFSKPAVSTTVVFGQNRAINSRRVDTGLPLNPFYRFPRLVSVSNLFHQSVGCSWVHCIAEYGPFLWIPSDYRNNHCHSEVTAHTTPAMIIATRFSSSETNVIFQKVSGDIDFQSVLCSWFFVLG